MKLVAVAHVLENEAVRRFLRALPENQQEALLGRVGQPWHPLLEGLALQGGLQALQAELLLTGQRGLEGQRGRRLVDPEQALGQQQALHVAEVNAHALLGLPDEDAHLRVQAPLAGLRRVPLGSPEAEPGGGLDGAVCPASRRCIDSPLEVAQNRMLHEPNPRGASADLAISRNLGPVRVPPREILLGRHLPTPGLADVGVQVALPRGFRRLACELLGHPFELPAGCFSGVWQCDTRTILSAQHGLSLYHLRACGRHRGAATRQHPLRPPCVY
mmetsp:Transcript_839/g.2178  ORF Transcript_839/g.2178 Transcript_839/m.2178 type:complete len:273 (-) Transcript_839:59-877(-)